MKGLTLIAACILPIEGLPERAYYDRLHVNHFYDRCGQKVFDQLICEDLFHDTNRFHAQDWRLIKSPNMVPHFDRERGVWRVTWWDGETLRCVESLWQWESWTQDGLEGDPEIVDREVFPKDRRRTLRREPCPNH